MSSISNNDKHFLLFEGNVSKAAKENVASLLTEHQRNINQPLSIPFFPPPPPLRLPQQKALPPKNYNSLEQSLIAAKNAAAMIKLQATFNNPQDLSEVHRKISSSNTLNYIDLIKLGITM